MIVAQIIYVEICEIIYVAQIIYFVEISFGDALSQFKLDN